jgi:large subunit ribosomal protein L15
LARKHRKVRKLRGSRTHGWGTSGQHRDSGSSGGRGRSGRWKHKWTYTVKHEPDRRGKLGFRCPTGRGILNTINVGELSQLAEKLLAQNKAKEEEGKIAIDLSALGYEKLLGGGKATRRLTVKVSNYSESAVKKIQEAGGEIVGSNVKS